jgi:MoaA/NifB/PqqE/SkfB family radical SAM enzyme
MYTVGDLRQLHIETSTRCNAACRMCARNIFGATAPGLVETSMTLQRFQRLVPNILLARWEIVDFCGAYGDPALTPELIDICWYITAVNPAVRIRVFSNGGVRGARWWRKAAQIPHLTVVFAIDGLATNDVYRRRVDVTRVLGNAKVFIDAGGCAQWDYLVFAHNEHEIDSARARAASLGFAEFTAGIMPCGWPGSGECRPTTSC